MATYWAFDHSVNRDGDYSGDPDGVSLGFVFTVTSNCNLTKIGFFKNDNDVTTTRPLGLFYDDATTSSQAFINSWTTSSEPTGTNQWIEYTLPTPVALTAGTTYCLAVGYPNGRYSGAGGQWVSDVISGPLKIWNRLDAAANTVTGNGNGRYTYAGNGTTIILPDNEFNSTNYWVDLQVDDSGGSPVDVTSALAFTDLPDTVAGTALVTPSWSFIGETIGAVNASGNYTLAMPAGAQLNDVIVVDFAARSTVLFANSDFTFPQSQAGGNTTNNSTASDVSSQAGYCFRGASDPSLVFTRTGGSRALGKVRVYRSSESGTPVFDTSVMTALGTAATAISGAGLTTTEADALIVGAVYGARNITVTAFDATDPGGASGASGTITPVNGTWTERSDTLNGTSPTVALTTFDGVRTTAGATGSLTATASASALHAIGAMAFKHPSSSASAAASISLGTLAVTAAVSASDRASVAATLGSLSASASAVVSNRATVSATLGAVTAAAAATSPGSAVAAITLGSLSASATATARENAAVAASLGALTATASASAGNRAVVNATLAALTVAATASDPASVSAAGVLGPLTCLAQASAPASVSVNATLGSSAATATAASNVGFAVNATLGTLTVVAAASVKVTALVATTLGVLSSASSASATIRASVNAALGALVATATASVPAELFGGGQLGDLLVTATALASNRANANIQLAPLTLVAAASTMARVKRADPAALMI